MNRTKIEYLDFTWNPIVMRCDRVSAGCKNCWHQARARMLANNPMIPEKHRYAYAGRTMPILNQDRLEDPLRYKKKKAMIGVQFMGDLFHKHVTFSDINDIFQIIAESVHTFLILTKRPIEMQRYINTYIQRNIHLPDNLWVGVSVEDKKTLGRIDELLKVRASVLYVSAEPLLENIDIRKYLYQAPCINGRPRSLLDWVICGPETGPGSRPCKPEWIRNIYDQTRFSCTPFFDKTKTDYIVREFPNEKR